MIRKILTTSVLTLLIFGVVTALYTTMPIPGLLANENAISIVKWTLLFGILSLLVLALFVSNAPEKSRKET